MDDYPKSSLPRGEGKPSFGYSVIGGLAAVLVLPLTLSLSFCHAGEKRPVNPSPKDKCPVCGMFVAKYPDWVSEIAFRDGSYAFFDGPKDLFKYCLNLQKYHPGKKPPDIDLIFVKDYYSLNFFDARKAYYVAGSDIYGPMGRELIPFEKEADAREFMKDHQGKSILRFPDVNSQLLRSLD